MIGDIVRVGDEEFEVIWAGGEGLVADRETKITGFWTPPKRIYNKKSEYWSKFDKPEKDSQDDGQPEILCDRSTDENVAVCDRSEEQEGSAQEG